MNVETKVRPLRFSASARPWLFLGLTVSLTWFFGFLAAAIDEFVPNWSVTTLHFVGGVIPLAVAAGLTHLKHDRPFQRDFWRRIIEFRRISFGWYAVVFLYTPVKSGLAALIDILLGGWGIAPETLTRFAQQPLLIVPTLFFWLLFGPVLEEPGWRGYAFYTWIYNNTNRSTLSAILFHFMGNAFGELFALSERAEVYNFVVAIVAVVLVVTIWGPRTLTGAKKDMLSET